MANGQVHPLAVPSGRPEFARLLPPVPGRGRRGRPPAARLHDAGAERHVGHHQFRQPGAQPADGARTAVHRAQPHLRRLRLQRPLRIAVVGADPWRDPCRPAVQFPAPAGRRVASALGARPQPLHPLLALRARLRRDRGRACLGHLRARHQLDAGGRTQPAMGRGAVLHQLRQVRAGLPDRRAGRERPGGRGDDQAQQRHHGTRGEAKGAAHDRSQDWRRCGSTAVPAATCRCSTWTRRSSRSRSGPTWCTARWSTRANIPTMSTSPSSRARSAPRRTWRRSARSANARGSWWRSATVRSPATSRACAIRSR